MTAPKRATDANLHAEDRRLRTDLEKIKEDQTQVDQRRTELIHTVKGKITALQQLLVQFGEGTEAPAPASLGAKTPRPGVGTRKDETPIIEYVRRELAAVGQAVATPALKQALMTKHGVPPNRLKNLSQILDKAPSVYKKDGKIGLVEWKRGPKGAVAEASTAAPPQKVSRKGSWKMSPAQRREVSKRMKAHWAAKREAGKKAQKVQKARVTR